jgi:uncharacterized protein
MKKTEIKKIMLSLLFCNCFLLTSCTRQIDQKLLEASSSGDSSEIKKLIAEGANPNSLDFEGQTALVRAISFNNADAVLTLIEYGANVNLKAAPGHSPLYWTTVSGCLECAKALLRHGAKIATTSTSAHLKQNLREYPELEKLFLSNGVELP